MEVKEQINNHMASLPEPQRTEMTDLHQRIKKLMPKAKLWYLDGRNDEGKAVTNPNIGYGSYTMKYTDGSTREFYQVGISAKTTGISVYIMGIKDKKYLVEAYGKRIGKAKVTGYCINFKTLRDVNIDVLEEAIRYRLQYEE